MNKLAILVAVVATSSLAGCYVESRPAAYPSSSAPVYTAPPSSPPPSYAPPPSTVVSPAPAPGYAPAPSPGYGPAPSPGYAPPPSTVVSPAPAPGYAPPPSTVVGGTYSVTIYNSCHQNVRLFIGSVPGQPGATSYLGPKTTQTFSGPAPQYIWIVDHFGNGVSKIVASAGPSRVQILHGCRDWAAW